MRMQHLLPVARLLLGATLLFGGNAFAQGDDDDLEGEHEDDDDDAGEGCDDDDDEEEDGDEVDDD